MPRARDLLARKSADGAGGLAFATPLTTVVDAAREMNERRVGALAVLDDDGRLVGMFTERDVLTRIVAAGRDPAVARVGDVMTTPVLVCEPGACLDDIRALMRERRIRHVPIVEEGRALGMVSIGDLNTAEARVMTETISYLEQYMYQP